MTTLVGVVVPATGHSRARISTDVYIFQSRFESTSEGGLIHSIPYVTESAGADPGILKGGVRRNFLQKGGGGPTTYSAAICIANYQKKGGSGPPGHPPGSAPDLS